MRGLFSFIVVIVIVGASNGTVLTKAENFTLFSFHELLSQVDDTFKEVLTSDVYDRSTTVRKIKDKVDSAYKERIKDVLDTEAGATKIYHEAISSCIDDELSKFIDLSKHHDFFMQQERQVKEWLEKLNKLFEENPGSPHLTDSLILTNEIAPSYRTGFMVFNYVIRMYFWDISKKLTENHSCIETAVLNLENNSKEKKKSGWFSWLFG